MLVPEPPRGEGRRPESTYDSYRTVVVGNRGQDRAFTRNGNDWSPAYRLPRPGPDSRDFRETKPQARAHRGHRQRPNWLQSADGPAIDQGRFAGQLAQTSTIGIHMALHREACRNHSGARQKQSDSCPPSSLVSIRTPPFDCFCRCIHIISDRGELGFSGIAQCILALLSTSHSSSP